VPRPLPILFQDDDLVAVHKPAGLLVHRTELDRGERAFALQVVRDQIGRRVYAAHRLDRGTSGVLLFGLRPEVGRALGALFEGREVHKTYLAVVRGHPSAEGTIDHPLRRQPDEREMVASHALQSEGSRPVSFGTGAPTPARTRPRALAEVDKAGRGSGPPVDAPTTEAQEALTRYRRLATAELPHRVDRYPTSRYALLELEPVTGRRHQLRRHLKHASHPIVGDATYGKARHNRLFEVLFDCRRLLLACVEVRLPHPVTGEPLTITAPLAEDFAAVVGQLGWGPSLPGRWLAGAEEGEPL
jgi:tRNA pseudouridine65 synthase